MSGKTCINAKQKSQCEILLRICYIPVARLLSPLSRQFLHFFRLSVRLPLVDYLVAILQELYFPRAVFYSSALHCRYAILKKKD